MKLGLDVFLESTYKSFRNKRIGLLTNITGVNKDLKTTIDLFYEHPDIQLTAFYAPEHGIRGNRREGEPVETFTDPYTGLPVYSLYGKTKKPTKEMLDAVDVVVFDLQDIGSRYYTYIYSMAYMMEACGKYNKQFVVLDRPNPISGEKVEGNLVEEDVRSFVGLYPIPNRHGMTVGELALFFKHEIGINCDLTVVEMIGWKRNMYFDDTSFHWVPPSPATTGMDMATLYPGTCLVEGTNLSEGRGTTKPFEWIGAPYIDGYRLAKAFNEKKVPGVIARPVFFTPYIQKYKNEECEGVQLHIVDRHSFHSLTCGLTLLETVADLYPEKFEFTATNEGKYFFDLLAGMKKLRDMILAGKTSEFLEECETLVEQFQKQRQPYLLYQ